MKFFEHRIPPVVIVLAFAGVMWLASSQLPSLAVPLPLRLFLAVASASAGSIFSLAGVAAFRKARTTVNPTRPGAASTMVTSGVYRLSRNPMYAGLLFILAGWASFLSHILAFLLLPVFVAYINRFHISPEERVLSSKFGDEHSDYMQSVRRWL